MDYLLWCSCKLDCESPSSDLHPNLPSEVTGRNQVSRTFVAWKIEVLPGNNFEVWYLPQLGQLQIQKDKDKTSFLTQTCAFYTKKYRRENNSTPVCPDLRKNSSIMGFLYFLCRFPYQTIPLKANIFLVYTNLIKIQRGL